MPDTAPLAGASERSPSRAQYFSWINNTNEGATAAQTVANLAFFRWLHDEFGMRLDLYAFDAGAIDGAGGYGRMDGERFHRQFPDGFAPIVARAADFGCRLGLWGGPDGFGVTPADERARHEQTVALCRDHGFALFKLDGVCGTLRPEKQEAFVRMMSECRRHVPDLIVLNHRLELGTGMPHATTFLWEGVETYIDVHIVNETCATHNRACTMTRGNVPGLKRLTEDHGVCLSSCLDHWEDDLVVQAFGRCLILAPELYGNPWLLRDDEFPRLARFFNLHRRWREALVAGLELPAATFGPHAISRGDDRLRVLVLRNTGWMPRTVSVPLDRSIGLVADGEVEVRRFHPRERVLGRFRAGTTVDVVVPPFQCVLVTVSAAPLDEVGVEGCDAEVVRDVAGRPVLVRLHGAPGGEAGIRLHRGARRFSTATLDGVDAPALLGDGAVRVSFAGEALRHDWHRRLANLAEAPVPDDAEALYETTCFAADNNAFEVRELDRSGPTSIPAVQAARDAFFGQPLLRARNLSDRNLFDDDAGTGLGVCRRWPWWQAAVRQNGLRLDLGRPTRLDRLSFAVGDEYALQPLKWQETVWGAVSDDLRAWTPVPFLIGTAIEGAIPGDRPWRYVRLDGCPDLVRDARASYRGVPVERVGWRASNLFSTYAAARAERAWQASFRLDEIAPGAYLAIAVHGRHGRELVSAALRVDGTAYRGAPRRSPSFPANAWECPGRPCDGDSTWYIPLDRDLIRRRLEAVVLGLRGHTAPSRCEAWITANHAPSTVREIALS